MEANDRSELVISDYTPTESEHSFVNNGCGISLRATSFRGSNQMYMAADATHFSKWLKTYAPETDLTMDKAPTLALHSHEFWMPLAILATDVTLQVYLALVASYIYDRLKGALRHDKHIVHLSVIYEDQSAGILKRLDYTGSVEGLSLCIKRTDLGKLLDG